ncbi:cytochrome P450 [Nocardia rhamnosiphila]|uniref:cytochrome P450 n=1 Tax=Nocardia rhamnosiphila TaxID=426716 RepID=UPI0027E2F00E|nr:cytochrome P450 [Nocardia zapadnayensis]
MSTPRRIPLSQSSMTAGAYPAAPGPVAEPPSPRYPMYTQEFATDPHRAYREMRDRFGPLVPVDLAPGVPATLVIDHKIAVRILNDPDHFPADPRYWQETVPQDSPVLPMMKWFPAARYNVGDVHARYRQASADSIDGVDLNALPYTVERIATPLINDFCENGTADLMSQYAFPLALEIINHICGCPDDIGRRIAAGMAARFDTVRAEEGMGMLKSALMELIHLKRDRPGDDATSRLAEHTTGLDDVEVFAQLMSFYGAGFEAQRNLITNALLLMITEPQYGPGNTFGGNLSTDDAIDNVLFNDPPMANFCTTYPRQPIPVADTWLPAHQPVVISLSACNNDPEIRNDLDTPGGSFVGNRSHLAWSVGPHACPAQSLARGAVRSAIDVVLNAIPDLCLDTRQELVWRPGPFHRALAGLPVAFEPAPPLPVM